MKGGIATEGEMSQDDTDQLLSLLQRHDHGDSGSDVSCDECRRNLTRDHQPIVRSGAKALKMIVPFTRGAIQAAAATALDQHNRLLKASQLVDAVLARGDAAGDAQARISELVAVIRKQQKYLHAALNDLSSVRNDLLQRDEQILRFYARVRRLSAVSAAGDPIT